MARLAPLPKGRDMLATFLSLMPDSAVAVDRKGTIVAVNERTETFFGYTASELEGKSIEVLVPERFRHSHRSQRAGYSSAPHARPMGAGLNLYARRKDGSEFPVDISLALIGPEDALSWLWRRCGTKAIQSRSGGGGAVVRGSRVLGRQFFFMSAVAL